MITPGEYKKFLSAITPKRYTGYSVAEKREREWVIFLCGNVLKNMQDKIIEKCFRIRPQPAFEQLYDHLGLLPSQMSNSEFMVLRGASSDSLRMPSEIFF